MFWYLGLTVLVVSTLFWVIAARNISLPFLAVAWVLFLKSGSSAVRKVAVAWGVWLALSFSPIDVMLIPKGGPPRLVPYVFGYPTNETAEKAKRGEVVLGGCIVNGLAPKYYLVW
jgi:hypothetical protein